MVDRRIVLVKNIIIVIIATIIVIVITRWVLVCTTHPARQQSAWTQDLSLSPSDPLMSRQVIIKIFVFIQSIDHNLCGYEAFREVFERRHFAELESEEEEDGTCITLFTK